MADGAVKNVVGELLDTWTSGQAVSALFTNLGPVTRGGDAVDVPYKAAGTVNTSESASPAALSVSVDAMTVSRQKFINQAVSRAQYDQLLGGSGKIANQLSRSLGGDLQNAIDRDLIEYMASVAGTSVDYHVNLAADAVTDLDVNQAEALMLAQQGVKHDRLFWLVNPYAVASIKSATDYVPSLAGERGELGIPMMGSLNGIPVYTHALVPGNATASRYSVATTAVTVATNVATATVTVPTGAASHGFVVGQMIYTTGLTANVPVGTPVAISAVTATTITYAVTAGDGAMADGVGSIISASSFAMLGNADWLFFAADGEIPDVSMVERTDAAGWALKLYQQIGRAGHAGSVVILHAPD